MKQGFLRIVSVMLMLVTVLGLFPGAVPAAKAWTVNQQRIADRCDYFYNTTWVAQKTVYGWDEAYIFYEGETYHLPYAQPVNAGQYIGYGVTLEEFQRKAADKNSVFYTRQSWFNGKTSTFYGMDSAAFVSLCWGVDRQDCTTIWNGFTNLGPVTLDSVLNKLQLGDALNSLSMGHIVLVSDLIYDDRGNLTTVEITEQTPPQLKRTCLTPEEVTDKYADAYSIFRWDGAVPEAPVRGYVSTCRAYDAHCEITATTKTPIMSLPCSEDVQADSENLGEVIVGASYTAVKLYENTAGELWYQIKAAGQGNAYIRAEAARYEGDILTDICFEGGSEPSAHVQGTEYALKGNFYAQYNRLARVNVCVYDGFGQETDPVSSGSDTMTGNAYTLSGSKIDSAVSLEGLDPGKHTYHLAVEYINYYVDQYGVICSNSGTLDLMEAYFMVVLNPVDQNTCVHDYEQTLVGTPTCAQPTVVVYSCGICGEVYKETDSTSGHGYGPWEVIREADCVDDGLRSRTCVYCGRVEEEVVPAVGHSYDSVVIPGNCQTYPGISHTCGICGDTAIDYAEELYSDWSEEVPVNVAEGLIQTQTQYRYSDQVIVTSHQQVLEGYELLGSAWAAEGTTSTVRYVSTWPAGFDVTHSLYTDYHHTPVKEDSTDTVKTVVNSDRVTGYIYYHWCYPASYFIASEKGGAYNTFHAFYSTVDPSTHSRFDPSDNSYYFANECCANSGWFYTIPVRTQISTVHTMEYTHGRWSEFGDWSHIQPEEQEHRLIEQRTLYRYVNGELGEHDWVNGVCSVCGEMNSENVILTGRNFSLSFEDEILVNFYFTAENAADARIGMLVFYNKPSSVDADAADAVYDAVWNPETALYCCTTDGIAAKQMGDARYYAAYAELSDGSVVYSPAYEYSPKKYALSRLANSNDPKMKALCVAMLNYGAAAQCYFGYRTDDLMNGSLTKDQQTLAVAYDPGLFAGVIPAEPSKVGIFSKTDVGFSSRSATVSFDGAFAINYYMKPEASVDGEISFYYWSAADYATAPVLTADNATGKLVMNYNGNGTYYARVTGIAAKQMDDTYYVAAVYSSGDSTCCSGVIAYSLSRYCMNNAKDGNAMKALAEATAIYGYHAMRYFG